MKFSISHCIHGYWGALHVEPNSCHPWCLIHFHYLLPLWCEGNCYKFPFPHMGTKAFSSYPSGGQLQCNLSILSHHLTIETALSGRVDCADLLPVHFLGSVLQCFLLPHLSMNLPSLCPQLPLLWVQSELHNPDVALHRWAGSWCADFVSSCRLNRSCSCKDCQSLANFQTQASWHLPLS